MATSDVFHMTHHAMASPWEVDIDNCPASKHDSLKNEICQTLDDFENTYSRFKPTSLVSHLRESQGLIEVPQPMMRMLRLCFKLYDETKGVFNPCIAQVLEDLGYDASYSLKAHAVIAEASPLRDAIELVSESEIFLHRPVALDLGAIGKGCAVDMLIELLVSKGYSSMTVNGSGDMKHIGTSGIRVGMEHPQDQTQAIGVYELHDQAIASSGSNRRNWVSHHHIIDPYTHQSPDYITATWVVADSAMYADALATTLFLTTPDVLKEHFSFEYALVNRDLQIACSPGWAGEVFS